MPEEKFPVFTLKWKTPWEGSGTLVTANAEEAWFFYYDLVEWVKSAMIYMVFSDDPRDLKMLAVFPDDDVCVLEQRECGGVKAPFEE